MSEFDIEKEAKIVWVNDPMVADIIAFGRRCADEALEKATKEFPCKRGCSCESEDVRRKLRALKSDGGK